MPRSDPPARRVVRTGPGVAFFPDVPSPPRVDDGARRVVRMDDEDHVLADQIGRELAAAERAGRRAGGGR